MPQALSTWTCRVTCWALVWTTIPSARGSTTADRWRAWTRSRNLVPRLLSYLSLLASRESGSGPSSRWLYFSLSLFPHGQWGCRPSRSARAWLPLCPAPLSIPPICAFFFSPYLHPYSPSIVCCVRVDLYILFSPFFTCSPVCLFVLLLLSALYTL